MDNDSKNEKESFYEEWELKWIFCCGIGAGIVIGMFIAELLQSL